MNTRQSRKGWSVPRGEINGMFQQKRLMSGAASGIRSQFEVPKSERPDSGTVRMMLTAVAKSTWWVLGCVRRARREGVHQTYAVSSPVIDVGGKGRLSPLARHAMFQRTRMLTQLRPMFAHFLVFIKICSLYCTYAYGKKKLYAAIDTT